MVQSITLSAEESLLQRASEKAAAEKTSLNEKFGHWLADYVGEEPDSVSGEERVRRFREMMKRLAHVDAGRKFTREEMNERR